MPDPRSFPSELLRKPVAERLAYFRQKTIAHPHLVYDQLAKLFVTSGPQVRFE